MRNPEISRRSLLKRGATLSALSVLQIAGPTQVLGQSADQIIPWLDQPPPPPNPNVGNLLKWEALDSWTTPAQSFFFVSHFGLPDGLNEATWRVSLEGLVARPRSLTLADLRARALHQVDFTLECSGNTGAGPAFIGAVGNARWGGARLAALLQEADILNHGTEVIFWGADRGTATIRDNSGVRSGGRTGMMQPAGGGGVELTITEQFARSMSVREALNSDNLLCFEMNGEPLPREHGFPLRLIAPGWYGVANVKWLTRIEVVDHRYTGRFMARDYVTIREEQRGDQTVWTLATVSHGRLKSAPAKVIRRGDRYAIMGAAWGAPIAGVEVQIDSGPWMRATIERLEPQSRSDGRNSRSYSWRFWTFDWGRPAAGEHGIRSRAIDLEGNVQPAPDDSFLDSKRTYWESNGHITRRVII